MERETDTRTDEGGEVGMMKHDQFAEMKFTNGASMFLNTEYITAYGYIREQDKTAVSVLGEGREIYFPGDQTAEIRNSINCIGADRE